MGKRLRRLFFGIVGVSCLSSLGCLYVPYCLPEVQRVAAVRVPWPSDDVHVFRVDGTDQSWHRTVAMIGDGPGGGSDEAHELARLQPSERKVIAQQWALGVERGWVCVGLVNAVAQSTRHTVALRLYRRGYETISIKPGDEEKDFEWKPVPDLAGQEKAVDDLIDTRARVCSLLGFNANTTAAPGVSSAAHREALRFCADEYDRIAYFVG